MPAPRGGTLTIFEGAMSRSKQLGGFATSGLFSFRQKHARAAAAKPVYELPTGCRVASAFSAAALAAMSISFSTP